VNDIKSCPAFGIENKFIFFLFFSKCLKKLPRWTYIWIGKSLLSSRQCSSRVITTRAVVTAQSRVNVLLSDCVSPNRANDYAINCARGRETLKRHYGDIGKSDVSSGSLCTCVSCIQHSLYGAVFAVCWSIRSFRAESHAAHQVSPCRSHLSSLSHHKAMFPPGPARSRHPSSPPVSSHLFPAATVPRSLFVPTARLSCGPWGRRLTPQVD